MCKSAERKRKSGAKCLDIFFIIFRWYQEINDETFSTDQFTTILIGLETINNVLHKTLNRDETEDDRFC